MEAVRPLGRMTDLVHQILTMVVAQHMAVMAIEQHTVAEAERQHGQLAPKHQRITGSMQVRRLQGMVLPPTTLGVRRHLHINRLLHQNPQHGPIKHLRMAGAQIPQLTTLPHQLHIQLQLPVP